ncbi:MAG: Ig-like domain-containing protein [Agathobacter sp.]|nr:Ig-like domain-containing protein [Agathobacter sp.]
MRKEKTIKKRVLAWMLALSMGLSIAPTTAFAAEMAEDETTIGEENESVLSEELQALQERINTLPTGDEYREMSAEEQDAVYETAASVSDAYFELSEEDQEKLDITKMEALFAVMNEDVGLYDTAGTVTFLNSGYPYGKDMDDSSITLVIEVDGSALSYQWQVAESKNGTFSNIDNATTGAYTFTPASGYWYRCVVNGTASEAVMAVKPEEDGRSWTSPYKYNYPYNSWYIGNGTMAYMANGTKFDVTGLYTKNGTNYMLQTSYSACWDLYSSDSATPEAADATPAFLDALRVSFDARDDYAVIFEADLADGQQAFSFGCDTKLGNGSTSGAYSDRAALNAMVKNGVLQQIAMIGAATVEGAADEDPAFVIAPIGPVSRFWIGHFSSRQTYAYNTSGGTSTEMIDGQSVVTLLEGADSGMTMSWMNISSGGSVKFQFSVGDVAHTGAVSGKVNYEKETLTGLEPAVTYIISYTNEEGNEETYTVKADKDGEIPLAGTDNAGKSYDFTGKTLTIAKQGSGDTPAEVEVAGRPETPDNPSDLVEGDDTTPTVDANIEIAELTMTSVTISPKEGQQYAYSTDGSNWTTVSGTDGNGNYVIAGLLEGSKVQIRTRVAATSEKPASQWSEPTEVQLKSTVKASATGWSGSYDKGTHSITVNVTSPAEDATITYSSTEDEGYSAANPAFVAVGEYKVYYRVVADGYYPAYGSATVTISPKKVALAWSNTEFTYNGSVQTPVATVTEDSLCPGDTCVVSVTGGAKNYSSSAYTATAIGLSNPNYKLPEMATQEFTIAQKELKLLWGSTNLTYNGSPQQPEVTVFNLEKEDESKVKVNVIVSGEHVNVNTDSGYTATASLEGEAAANYKLSDTASDNQTTFKIYPKKITAAMVTADTSYVYTGSDISPQIAVEAKLVNEAGESESKTLTKGSDYTLSGDISGKDVKSDYKVIVKGTGNYTGTVEVAYRITDSQPPTGTIEVSTNSWKELLSGLNFGVFYKERQTVKITAEDEGSGVDKIYYFLTSSGTAMDQEKLAALPDSKWKEIANGGTFTIDPDNKYVIYAKITDKSGNVTFISSDEIIVDKTAPAITGIENNKTYCADVTFAVSDAIGLASVKIDDVEQDTSGRYSISASTERATHTIVAEDKSGNKTTYTITINADGEHSFGAWTVTTDATCDEAGVESHTCSACGLVETRDIEKIGHAWENDAHFIWTAVKDANGVVINYEATAYFVCKNDFSHTSEVKDCSVTKKVTTPATEGEEVTYTAEFSDGDKLYEDIKTTNLTNLIKLQDPDFTDGNSNIYTSTSVAEKAPETTIDDGLDTALVKDLMSPADMASYDDPDVATDVTIYLEVQSITGAVPNNEKVEVETQMADLVTEALNTAEDVEVESGAAYVDLSMYKNIKTKEEDVVTSDATTQITDTGTEITITMAIPDDIDQQVPEGFTRTYNVIRVHDGNAEVLPSEQNGNQLTFRTSKFSTYAVTYVDVKNPSANVSSGSGTSYVPVDKVRIETAAKTLTKQGETLQLTVNITPQNATDQKLTWISSDLSVATVDANGKVTAVGDGTVTITAKTSNGKIATITIMVEIEQEKPDSGDIDMKLDTSFATLRLAYVSSTKTTATLNWKEIEGADGYVVYGAPCNTKGQINKVKKLAVIKNGVTTTYKDKGLKSGTYYKYVVKAYKLVDDKKVFIARSKTVHVTTAGGKYGNAKSVKVNKTSVNLTTGEKFKVKASMVKKDKTIKQHVEIRYETSNSKVATVNSKGVITAKGKGTCYIYVYAQNGVYKRIKVTVK